MNNIELKKYLSVDETSYKGMNFAKTTEWRMVDGFLRVERITLLDGKTEYSKEQLKINERGAMYLLFISNVNVAIDFERDIGNESLIDSYTRLLRTGEQKSPYAIFSNARSEAELVRIILRDEK